jgi:hypothetical protein
MHNNQENPWTPYEIATLRADLLAGRSGDEIAKKIGRTEGAVFSKAKRIGLRTERPLTHRDGAGKDSRRVTGSTLPPLRSQMDAGTGE